MRTLLPRPELLLAAILLSGAAAAQDERPAGPGEWGFRPAAGEVVARTPPPFSWRPQAGAASYELEVAAGASFERVEYRAEGLPWNVHCPPRALAAGEWSWRFRALDDTGEAGPWSSARRFVVPADAAVFPLPPREELLARVPDAHPRLFLRPEDLEALRSAVRGPLAAELDDLLARCDALLADPPPSDEPPRYPQGTVRGSDPWREIWWGNRRRTIAVLDGAATLGFAWRLTERLDYGTAGRELLLAAAAWDPKGATGYRYNDEAGMPYAYHLARAYTFLHPLLADDERRAIRDVVRVRGREMFAHLCPGHLWKPFSSHSNRAWHFLGEVAIAFHGEIDEADEWLAFALDVFACVYPVWSDEQGGWHEGNNYWSSYLSRFTWWADVMRAAVGLDAYQLPYFSRAGDYALTLMPPGTRGGGFGDLNGRRRSAQNVPLMTVLAAQSGNPFWRWYVEAHGGPQTGGGYVGLLRSALPAVEPRPPTDQPTSRCFRGTGLAVLNRTLLDATENVEVVFKSSPFGTQSHGYEAQNAFLLYAFGERLLIRSGYRDSYGSDHHRGWMWDTRSVNTITVGGKGQREHSASAVGEITAFHTEPGLHYVEGEAAPAYAGALTGFRRGILLLEPDLVIVHDRLVAPAETTFEWNLHAREPFELSGTGRATARGGSAAGEIWFLAPADLALEQSDRFDPPPRERIQLVEHHLTATSRAAREQTFVTALRPYRAGEQPPPAPTLEPVAGGYLLRAELGDARALVLLRAAGAEGPLEAGGLRTAGALAVRLDGESRRVSFDAETAR